MVKSFLPTAPVAVEITDEGYGYAELEDGWYVCDMFGKINLVGLPTRADAAEYLRTWITNAGKQGRAS